MEENYNIKVSIKTGINKNSLHPIRRPYSSCQNNSLQS